MCLVVPATAFAQEAQAPEQAPPVSAGGAIDWTTGPTFGKVPTLGGTQGLGLEARVAALGMLELAGRYEMLVIPLPADMGNAYSHQLFGQLKLRWITDSVRNQLWAIGAGYGTAFRPDTLGGRATIVRASLTRQIGIPGSRWDTGIELAFERSLGDMPLDMVLGSIRLGVVSGTHARYLGPSSPLFARTVSFDAFFPWGAGMTLGVHANRTLSLETTANYISDLDVSIHGVSQHGFRGAQWALQTGPRVQLDSWPAYWAPAYAQVQGGVGWLARDPGEARAVQTAEVGVRLVCSDFGFDAGIWVRTDIEDGGLHAIGGGLSLRIVLATDRIIIGGHNTACADDNGGSSAGHETHTLGTVSTEGSSSLPSTNVSGQLQLQLPAPRVEQVSPRPGSFWIAGHWEWRGSTWIWTGGHWEAERPGMHWVPGTNQLRGNVYVWVDGHWATN